MLTFRANISRRDYLLAFLAGLMLVLAFAPFEWRPFACLSPAILFWLNLKPMLRGQRMQLAWVYGIGVFAGGAHWIYFSIHFFGGANSLIAAAMVAVFVVLIALTQMLFGWLAHFFPYQLRWTKLLIVFPAAWGLTEWLRTWLFTGFPWLQLGHTQADTWLAAYAPLIGSLGISWLMALGTGALLLVFAGSWGEKFLGLLVAASITGGGFALGKVDWTTPVDQPITVSMIQGNILQQEKWQPQLRSQHIQQHIDLMEPHLEDSDLIIWPETAIPDTFNQSMDDVILPLQKLFKGLDSHLLAGGFYYEEATRKTYNAVIALSESRDVYAKRHLVPFSEYIPLLEYLRWMERFIILPYDNVAKWRGKTNLMLAGQPMRISICYEDAYGSGMLAGLPEATMLVNVSNDGWFTGSIEPAQHAEIARMRALETGRYLLRATNNGVSAIINHKGEVTATAEQYQQAVIKGQAQPMQGGTPYMRWANWPLAIMLALLLLITGWLGRGKFR